MRHGRHADDQRLMRALVCTGLTGEDGLEVRNDRPECAGIAIHFE